MPQVVGTTHERMVGPGVNVSEGPGTTSCSPLHASPLGWGSEALNLSFVSKIGDESTASHSKIFDTMKCANHMFVNRVRRREL